MEYEDSIRLAQERDLWQVHVSIITSFLDQLMDSQLLKKLTEYVVSVGNACEVYLGGARCEFRPEYRLFSIGFFVVFLSASRQIR
jgi:hypothetical protein